jgi:hypothetical protein
VTKGSGTDASGPAGTGDIADAGLAVLRGGTVPAACAGALGAAVSALWGWTGAAGFAAGALLATGALAVGPLLLRASRHASPPAVTAMAGGGYAAVVILLGLVLVALGPVPWLSAAHLAAALVAVTVAGLAGQIRVVTRLRVLVFGSPLDDRDGMRRGPRNGDAAQSSQQAGR